MRVFTYSEARQNLAKLLTLAQKEIVRIRRRDGSIFSLSAEPESTTFPFDVPGIETRASTGDILSAVKTRDSADPVRWPVRDKGSAKRVYFLLKSIRVSSNV